MSSLESNFTVILSFVRNKLRFPKILPGSLIWQVWEGVKTLHFQQVAQAMLMLVLGTIFWEPLSWRINIFGFNLCYIFSSLIYLVIFLNYIYFNSDIICVIWTYTYVFISWLVIFQGNNWWQSEDTKNEETWELLFLYSFVTIISDIFGENYL